MSESGSGEAGKAAPLRRRRWLIVAAVIVAVIVALFLVLIPGCRRDYSLPPVPEAWETEALIGLTMRVSKAMFDRNGKPAQRAEIELSEAEMNAAIRNGLRFAFKYAAHPARELPSIRAVWRKGAIDADISAPLWPVGAVNISLRLIPEYADGEFRFAAREIRVGRLPVPSATTSRLLNRRLASEVRNRPELATALKAVESMTPLPDGGLKVVFNPRQAAEMLNFLFRR